MDDIYRNHRVEAQIGKAIGTTALGMSGEATLGQLSVSALARAGVRDTLLTPLSSAMVDSATGFASGYASADDGNRWKNALLGAVTNTGLGHALRPISDITTAGLAHALRRITHGRGPKVFRYPGYTKDLDIPAIFLAGIPNSLFGQGVDAIELSGDLDALRTGTQP